MANKKIIENENFQNQEINISEWKSVLLDNLSDKDKELFLRRKKAVELYLNNEITISEIEKLTHIYRNEIRRYIKRCLTLNEQGEVWGFIALLPNKRIKQYCRNDKILSSTENLKFTGAFDMLLNKYPRIKEKIMDLYLKRDKKEITDPNIKPKYVHKKFLQLCHLENIKEVEYPFNTKDLAKRSLYRFLKKLDHMYFSEATKRFGDEVHRHAITTGIGDNTSIPIIKPYQRVQFDGHKIDSIFAITFKTPEGDEITRVMDRIWLLVIIDVATRTILGYYITLSQEYSSYDVLKCIKNSIIPKQKMNFSIPGFKYPVDEGYPSLKLPELQWALWDEFLYDNGKANLAQNVRDTLTQIVGCSVNAGPVSTPERRGIIERFFGILEENGYHRLPNTTGNNPSDPRKNNPEKNAIKYNISFEHIEEITELLIANYNLTSHEGINNFTPLELMHQRIKRGLIPRIMNLQQQKDIMFLALHIQRTVQGSLKSGRRPYVYYEGVEYRNEVLSRSPQLVGTKLSLIIDTDDLRAVRAYLPDGSEFGVLTATGKWGVIPHTLQIRKEINKLKEHNILHFTVLDDPIEIYQKYLSQNSTIKKGTRNKLANLKKYKKEKNVEPNNDNNLDKTKHFNPSSNKEENNNINSSKSSTENTDRIEQLKNSKAFKTYNF